MRAIKFIATFFVVTFDPVHAHCTPLRFAYVIRYSILYGGVESTAGRWIGGRSKVFYTPFRDCHAIHRK